MAYSTAGKPIYYPEDYDYSLYYESEFHDYTKPFNQVKKPEAVPAINYFNERKCPIYIHPLRADSSVYNNYGQKLTSPRTRVESPRVAPQIASKFVLDKLEETYWATWKPKKENLPVKKKSPRKVRNLGFPDSKPSFQVHNQSAKKHSNKPHGDVNDNIIKYFKANDFESSSTVTSGPDKGRKKSGIGITTISVVNENAENKKPNKNVIRSRKFGKVNATDSVSQEIQTEVHCPVILEQISEDAEESNDCHVIFQHPNEARETHVNVVGQEVGYKNEIRENDKESEKQKEQKTKEEEKSKQEEKNKPEEKNKKRPKPNKIRKKKEKEIQEKTNLVVIDDTSDIKTFIALKDSIDIAKEKQNSNSREQYQQPKCIRLYRKYGSTSSYTKGGTYPLKSCLKKDSFPKGNFRLGAPGSPLFITNSSFSNRRKK